MSLLSWYVYTQVVAVGPGKKQEGSEEVAAPNVSVGQTVMYSKYSGTEFEVRDDAHTDIHTHTHTHTRTHTGTQIE